MFKKTSLIVSRGKRHTFTTENDWMTEKQINIEETMKNYVYKELIVFGIQNTPKIIIAKIIVEMIHKFNYRIYRN